MTLELVEKQIAQMNTLKILVVDDADMIPHISTFIKYAADKQHIDTELTVSSDVKNAQGYLEKVDVVVIDFYDKDRQRLAMLANSMAKPMIILYTSHTAERPSDGRTLRFVEKPTLDLVKIGQALKDFSGQFEHRRCWQSLANVLVRQLSSQNFPAN
jgi:hypothetical protein